MATPRAELMRKRRAAFAAIGRIEARVIDVPAPTRYLAGLVTADLVRAIGPRRARAFLVDVVAWWGTLDPGTIRAVKSHVRRSLGC